MANLVALLDANVLYSASIRDITLQLARNNMIRVRWTSAIQDEWTNALLIRSRHINRDSLLRTRHKMDAAFRGALVLDYEHLIEGLDLPDPNDRHVLAAAIRANCNVLVTHNLRHFPPMTLKPYGLQVEAPDSFLVQQLRSNPSGFLASIRRILARLRNPPYSAEEYLMNIRTAGLNATAAELAYLAHLLE